MSLSLRKWRSLRSRILRRAVLSSLVAGAFSFAGTAHGADRFWDAAMTAAAGGGTGTWDTVTANWFNGAQVAWASVDDAVFGGTAGTVTLGEPITANSLAFSTTGYTLGGASPLTITTGNVTVDTGVSASIGSGLFNNTQVLNKLGAGTLVLTNAGVSTRTAATTVSAGTLSLANIGALGTGDVTVDGATSILQNGTLLANSLPANVILANGGTLRYNPATAGTNTLNFAAGKSLNIGTGGGTIDNAAAAGTLANAKINLTAGQLTGSGAFTKVGGGTLQLAGANSGYTGTAATINGGVVEFQNIDSLGTGTATVTVGAGEFATGGIAVRHNFVLNTGATISSNAATGGIYNGTINVAGNSNIPLRFFHATGTGSALRINGDLSGAGNLNVTAPNAQTLTLGTTPLTVGTATNNTGFTGNLSAGANTTVVINQRLGAGSSITLAGGTVQHRSANLVSPAPGTPGVTGTYYNFGSNPGTGANNFAVDQLYLSPRAFSRNDLNVNMPNGGSGNAPIVPVSGYAVTAGMGQNDGVMWKGLINITNAGTYQFSGTNDDALVLIIDGQQVGTLGVTAANANIGAGVVLSAGAHSIVVKQTQGTGGGYSTLSYNGGAGSDAPTTVIVPASAFTNGSLAATNLGPVTVTANSTLDISSLSVTSGITLGNGTFTLTSATIDNLTATGASTINAATPTLAPTSGGLIFAGAIGQDIAGRALNIAGPYFTEFQATNTYDGLTNVTGGQLRLNAVAGNSIAGNLTVNAANANGLIANVRLQQNNQIADTATVTMTNGILDIGAFSDTVTNLNMNGGQILGTSGVLTVTNAPTLSAGYIGANLAGNYTLSKTGTGTASLGGNNTYTGLTNVTTGVLQVRGGATLGASGAGNETTVTSGAALQLVGSSTATENFTISGTGVTEFTQNGALRNVGGITQINNLTTGSASNLGVDAGQLIINGTLDVSLGALTKTGVGVLTFSGNQASIPAVTLSGGALGFSGPQSFGTATVPAGLAYQFDSNPGAGVTAVTVGGTSAIIGNYAVDNAFVAKIDPASTGALLLGADNANALSLTSANVALGAKGLVNYSGTLTPNAAGYNFGGLAGQGTGLNQLTVSSVLTGTNPVNVTGGTVNLAANNTQVGTVSVTGGGTLRILNNTNLGAAANGVTLDNGGILQVVSNSDNTGAVLFGQLGNPLGVAGASRVITIGAGGGTIEVAARQNNGNSYAFTGANTLAGSGTLTKSGLGFLFVMNSQAFTGGLTIAPNGGTFDVRSAGTLASMTGPITIGQSGLLNVDAQNGLGSRQFPAGVAAIADRISNSSALNLAGGSVTYTSRSGTLSSSETFGVVNLDVGQSNLNANSNSGGNSSSIITYSGLNRVTGSTLRFGGTTGALGTAAAPTANNTNFIITGQATTAILPYASQFGTSFVAYGANGIVNPTYVTTTTAAGFVAANIADQTGDVALTAGNKEVNAFRQSGAATRNLTFAAQTDTLFVTSGGYISDGNNNARNIGTGGAAVATNIQGQITAGPLSGATAPQELFLHNNANTLTVFSKIVDNNSQAVTVVKDLDGTVTLQPNVNISTTWVANTNSFTVADTTLLRVGQPIIGVAGSAFIASITSGTTFTANGAPTAASATAFVNYGTPNTNTGGVFVTRGTLNSAAVGALGTAPAGGATTSMVTVKNATLNLNNIGGVDGTVNAGYTGPVYTTLDQGSIVFNVNSGTLAGAFNTATDRFSIGTGSTISNAQGAASVANRGLNSLTRVATNASFTAGGQIFLAPGAIVRHQMTNTADQGTGVLTIQNLGTNADLFFAPGNFGGAAQTVTLGAGTPWAGMSSDRNGLTWNSGTIYANSDFTLQGLTRDGGIASLTLGAVNSPGGLSIVNNSNGPIRATVVGNVVINEEEPVFQPSNLTYVLTPGSLFQPNFSMSMGFGASQAKILVQAGGTLDTGNYVAIGAAANTTRNPDGSLNGTQNLPYALPSPVNGQLTVEAGGRFLINDASGIGSAPIGSWTMKSGSIMDLGSANAFYGRGAYGLTQTGPIDTTGVIQNGQFVYENGVVVRIQADNIYKLSQFMPSAAQAPVIEIFNGNRILTSQNNPFIVPVVGTPTIAPETVNLGNGTLTNDANDRQVTEGRGKLVLQNGATIASTSQTNLNVQEGLEVAAGATITVGSSSFINGMSKNGLVQFIGPQSNTFGAGAKLVVADGAAFGLTAQNTFPDTTPIELPAAVTNVAPAGAAGFNPGNGSTLLSNTGNFAEIVGHVTGDGSVIGNAAGSFLGINATSNFTSNIRFRTANTGQQANFWKIGSGVMTVTGASDSTGQLLVGAGELRYSGTGSSLFDTNRVQKGGTLTLDNSGTAVSNRLGGITKNVSPMGGTLNLIGNASTGVEERFSNFFNSASGQGPFLGATGVTTIKITPDTTPGAPATTILVNTAENFQSAGIAQQRSGVFIINTPTAANAPITYLAGGGIAGGIVPGAAAGSNGLLQIASPNFTVGNTNSTSFGIQSGGVYGSAGTPVAATRGDYLGDANNDGAPEGFMTQDGVFLPVTNTSGTAILTGLNTTGLLPDMLVQGSVPAGTRILSVDSPTQVTLTANTTAAAANMQFISGGMRNLVASEYTATLRDNFIGGLNVRLAGATSAFGNTGLSSLTMTPGSTLNINGNLPNGTSSSQVNIASGGIFVQSGGTATINGSPYGTSRAFLRSSGGASLFLHAQGDLNVNAAVFTDNAIVKTGPGTVTFGDRAFDAFRGSLQIDAGTVTLGTNNTMSNIRSQNGSTSNGNLYINGGTLNLGGNSQMINVLTNNNELPGMGGTITSASPATLTVTGGGRFSGSIGGSISIDKNANNTLLLTSGNTYTGTTLVRAGTLSLRDSGTLANTSAIDVRYGTLQYDNGYLTSMDNRVPAGAPVTLRGATINITGAAGQVVSQTHNLVTLAEGRNDFTSNAGGSGANEMNIGNLVRATPGTAASTGSVLNFQQNYGFLGAAGNNTTAIRNFVTNVNGSALALNDGIIGGWAVVAGSNFATYIPTTGVGAMGNTADGYLNYDSVDATTATATQNVNDGTARTFTASKTINSWRSAPGAGITHTFNAGVVLTIDTGGLLSDANQTIAWTTAANGSGAAITSNSGELVSWVNQNTNGLNLPITGAIDYVKTGPGSMNLRPEGNYTFTSTTLATVPTANTAGLVVGMPVSGTNIPAGTVISAVSPGVSFTLSNAPSAAITAITPVFGNTYSGKTIVNSGLLTLNLGAAGTGSRTNFVAVPGDLIINNATVTEGNVANQIASTSNVTIAGGGRLNLVNVGGVTETLNSLTFLDGAGATGTANGIDRTALQLTSTINLTAPTAITSTNTNPTTGVPLIGGFTGNIAFTNVGGSTLNINSPVAVNGVVAVGLRIGARIGSVPTLAEGGLIKSGTGLLTLDPDQNPVVATTGTTAVSSPVITGVSSTAAMAPGMQVSGTNIPAGAYIISVDSATQITISANAATAGAVGNITGQSMNFTGALTSAQDVLNIQSGIVRADRHGALGSPFATTTVQSGAVLLGANTANQVITGSVTLKAGSTLGATINGFTLGAATDVAANQTVLSVPTGTVNIAAYDYFVPATNNGNITVNGRLTGAGTISLVGSQITQGNGGGGVFQLGNPILTGTGSNDFSGTITVGTNAILQNQVALIAKNNATITRTTGNSLGSATINLAGGRLRLRDDASANADVSNTTVTYGNNVNLTADSFLDANRQTSTTAAGNVINLGTLNVSGTRVLTVDSGNNYQVGFTSLDGTGNLIKGGNGRLNINSIAGSYTGGLTIAGPVGITVAPSVSTDGSGIALPATTNLPTFAVSGIYTTETSKTLNIAGTFSVNSNVGGVGDVARGLSNNDGRVAVTNTTTLTAATFQNNGAVGPLGGAATITASTGFTGSGQYVTTSTNAGAITSQPLTLAGNVTGGNLRTAGLNTVTVTGSTHTLGTAAQVQGGTLSLAPVANAATSGTITVFGVPAVTASPTASPIAAVNGILDFSAPIANTITHTGNIENSGLVRASTGSAVVTGSINGSAALRYTPGLMEGLVMGTTTFTVDNTRPANPGNFGVQREPRMLQTNVVTGQGLTGHLNDDVWVYNGYVKDDDGVFSFAGNQDDNLGVWINGVLVLNSGGNVVGSTALKETQGGTGVVTANGNGGTPSQNFGAGITLPGYSGNWYEVEIRMRNGTGGAGPWTGAGFNTNYGFGYKNGIGALDGNDYIKPVDDGTGNLFVTAVGSKGNITVQSAASLSAGGFTQIAATQFGDITQAGGTSTFNVTANATPISGITGGNNTDTLSVVTPTSTANIANFNLAGGTQAVVTTSTTVDAGQTLNVGVSGLSGGRLVLPAASSLALNGNLNITGSGPASGPTVLVNVPSGSSTGTGVTTVATGGILGGSGSLPTGGTLNIAAGGTLSPGNSPGIIGAGSTTWSTGGNYNWQAVNLSSTTSSGSNFDALAVTGSLTVQSGFNFNLWSLASTGPDVNGNVPTGFSSGSDGYWVVATTTTGGFTALDLGGVNIVTAAANGTGGFTNSLGGGSFSLVVGASGIGVPGTANDVVLKFTAATAGTTGTTYTLGATPGTLNILQGGNLPGSVTVQNTGTGTNDTLTFTSLTGTSGTPSVATATGTLSGGTLAQGASAVQNLTVNGIANGSATITSTVASATNTTLATPATLSGTAGTINVVVGNASFNTGGNSTVYGDARVLRTAASNVNYNNLLGNNANWSSNTTGLTASGGGPIASASTATILRYDNSVTGGGAETISMQWRTRTTAEANPSNPNAVLSDIVNLTGMISGTETLTPAISATGTGVFVLQMSYLQSTLTAYGLNENSIATSGELRLGWNDAGSWKTAGLGNVGVGGGTTTFVGAVAYNPLNPSHNVLGAYGVDPSDINGGVVWAVLNHNSEFAVIPEPSTLVLGGLALLGLAGIGLRRRRMSVK